MAASHPRLRFHFDYISSNAYLAWADLPRLRAVHGVEVEPVPTLFAALLDAHDQLGPAEVRAKALWMWKNCLRKAAVLGVPLCPPAFHPFNPLLSLRVSSLPMPEDERTALVDALFRAVWAEGEHVSEPAVVERVADRAGLDGARLVAEAGTPEAKARLRRQTDEAIAAGVFGVPTVIVGDELFWGYDDFPWLERHLAGRDPIDPTQIPSQPTRPRASAMRRRFRGWGPDREEPMARHRGGCLCGGIRFEIRGPVGPIGLCHDPICRKAHSAAFAAHAAIAADRLRWIRGEDLIARFESSPGAFRWFCRRCGSHLTGHMPDPPGANIVISVGSLDGDPGSRPVAHENVGAKAPWFEITDGLPQFEGGFPKGREVHTRGGRQP